VVIRVLEIILRNGVLFFHPPRLCHAEELSTDLTSIEEVVPLGFSPSPGACLHGWRGNKEPFRLGWLRAGGAGSGMEQHGHRAGSVPRLSWGGGFLQRSPQITFLASEVNREEGL